MSVMCDGHLNGTKVFWLPLSTFQFPFFLLRHVFVLCTEEYLCRRKESSPSAIHIRCYIKEGDNKGKGMDRQFV